MSSLIAFLETAFHFLIDLVLHLDAHLNAWVAGMGLYFYGLVFAIIFAESGIVFLPFLPGDSLLFALGALGASGALDLQLLIPLMLIGGIGGGIFNFEMGTWLGEKMLARPKPFLIKREHIEKTRAFYEKHGGKTILLARFIPIIRTLAPFVAGVAKMDRKRFTSFNLVGGTVWVFLLVGLGYLFGNLEIVKKNFGFIVPGIIIVSVLPIAWEYIQALRLRNKSQNPPS